MAEKESKGRQKIEIAKIRIKSHLQVTFSKRKSGLFKKASELCTLCGVNIAIIVFSPAGKIFSFGHPDIQSLVHSFYTHKSVSNLIGSRGRSDIIIQKLSLEMVEVINQLEAEKKRGEMLGEMRRFRQERCRWEAPVSELSLYELQQLKVSMEELKKIVGSQAQQILMEMTSANPLAFVMANGDGIGLI